MVRFCRPFLSGGTRIRTGDTMIFRHLPKPLGMRVCCIPKQISVCKVSLDVAWYWPLLLPYCCQFPGTNT